ncbi:collagen alpha-1(I) chain-like [Hippopotamus amphibius kiboko]|uniref:collagen alpha-1(I) chain-like n=1 Tax=Hippopotamus amphibius kiboko TaxID=575201 RepID=UPI00259A159D|nr:collagen alpha-1(I) chain-like [Hippopotamus amphibius kiboko]
MPSPSSPPQAFGLSPPLPPTRLPPPPSEPDLHSSQPGRGRREAAQRSGAGCRHAGAGSAGAPTGGGGGGDLAAADASAGPVPGAAPGGPDRRPGPPHGGRGRSPALRGGARGRRGCGPCTPRAARGGERGRARGGSGAGGGPGRAGPTGAAPRPRGERARAGRAALLTDSKQGMQSQSMILDGRPGTGSRDRLRGAAAAAAARGSRGPSESPACAGRAPRLSRGPRPVRLRPGCGGPGPGGGWPCASRRPPGCKGPGWGGGRPRHAGPFKKGSAEGHADARAPLPPRVPGRPDVGPRGSQAPPARNRAAAVAPGRGLRGRGLGRRRVWGGGEGAAARTRGTRRRAQRIPEAGGGGTRGSGLGKRRLLGEGAARAPGRRVAEPGAGRTPRSREVASAGAPPAAASPPLPPGTGRRGAADPLPHELHPRAAPGAPGMPGLPTRTLPARVARRGGLCKPRTRAAPRRAGPAAPAARRWAPAALCGGCPRVPPRVPAELGGRAADLTHPPAHPQTRSPPRGPCREGLEQEEERVQRSALPPAAAARRRPTARWPAEGAEAAGAPAPRPRPARPAAVCAALGSPRPRWGSPRKGWEEQSCAETPGTLKVPGGRSPRNGKSRRTDGEGPVPAGAGPFSSLKRDKSRKALSSPALLRGGRGCNCRWRLSFPSSRQLSPNARVRSEAASVYQVSVFGAFNVSQSPQPTERDPHKASHQGVPGKRLKPRAQLPRGGVRRDPRIPGPFPVGRARKSRASAVHPASNSPEDAAARNLRSRSGPHPGPRPYGPHTVKCQSGGSWDAARPREWLVEVARGAAAVRQPSGAVAGWGPGRGTPLDAAPPEARKLQKQQKCAARHGTSPGSVCSLHLDAPQSPRFLRTSELPLSFLCWPFLSGSRRC